jgi:hypothetical protein
MPFHVVVCMGGQLLPKVPGDRRFTIAFLWFNDSLHANTAVGVQLRMSDLNALVGSLGNRLPFTFTSQSGR